MTVMSHWFFCKDSNRVLGLREKAFRDGSSRLALVKASENTRSDPTSDTSEWNRVYTTEIIAALKLPFHMSHTFDFLLWTRLSVALRLTFLAHF